MSHNVHPYSHRLGIIRDWKSRWFSSHKEYKEFLKADVLLRQFLEKKLKGNYVEGVEMERNGKNLLRIVIKTSKPGLIIGRSGEGSAKLKEAVVEKMKKLKILIPKEIKIDIEEVRSPESHSAIVAQMIAEGLQKRLPFMRVMKQALEKVMANRDVKGVKITLSGRLGGADMSRVETVRAGRLPLQTLRSDIDFAKETAQLPYGVGIKVWIYRGDIFASQQAKKIGF